MTRNLAAIFAMIFLFQAAPALSAEKKVNGRKPQSDKTPPMVYASSSLNPPRGGLINNARPTVSAEYVDDGIGIDTSATKLFLDGQDVSATAQITQNKINYAPAQPLVDGGHKVKLEVADKAGNVDSVEWSFTIHTQPPRIKIASHKQNQYVNRSPVLITGTVDDPRARIVVNGITASVEKEAFSARVSLVEGNNTITATATDAFGNTGNDYLVIIVDTKPPVVEITSPTANSLLNARTVTVTGIADKNTAAVTVGTRAGEQVQAELNAGKFTARDVKVEEGVNVISSKAVSLAGNNGSASVKITVDSAPPRVVITSPKDHTVTNKKMISVTGTVDDPTATVLINNTPVQIAKGMFSLSSVNLAEGSNTITATATDRAGNKSLPSAITVVLDTTPPAVPTLAPLPPVTRSPSVIVAGNTEPGAVVEIYVNSASKGSVKADDKGAFSLKVNLSDGSNAITAIACDAPGNFCSPSAVINVFLDTKPPKIL